VTLLAPTAVYVLCLITSVVCAVLLLRAYVRSKARLLLWTALSFVCLAVNNLFLVGDKVVFPSVDLLPMRQLWAVGAIAVLLYGFIWEAEG
jgi:hypothetical protein